MQLSRLGGSGLEVSRLALGTMSWGAAVDEYVADEQLKAFLDAGGTLLDTAPIYGDGACEQVCFDRAGELQTRRWQDLADCLAEHACVDGPCYEEHCLAELRACVAP